MNNLIKPSTHLHGGNIDEALQRYGILLKQPVTDFSVNINPLGPPEIIRRQWPDWFGCLSSYPSQNGRCLEDFYRHRFDLPKGSVLAGNGSIELIYLVPRALVIKKALIFTPSFHDYQRACEIAGASVTKIPLIHNMSADYPVDNKILAEIESADAVFLGNPNNPTGSLMDAQTLLNLANRFPGTWFFIDEAFSQFLEDRKPYSLLFREKLRENIIIFHSLTKFYALPGLRMGAAISHPETIARLAGFKEPWTVNALAEKAAIALMDCRDYEINTRHLVSEQRKFLVHALRQMPGIDLFDTPANFLFARLHDAVDPDAFIAGLLNQGIFIRDCRNFEGLEGHYVRMAVRGKDDNRRLIQGFQNLLEPYNA